MALTNNNLDELVTLIREWAYERNLPTGDPAKQTIKLGEEFGEICEGIAKNKYGLVVDGIGDLFVVITILAMQLGIKLEDCVQIAYDEIKDRKGKLVNGVFVKEGDLNS